MGGHMEVSASLRDSLVQIAAAAHDKSLTPEDKAKKLSELAGPALIMLENMIENVGGTRRELLQELRDMIESGTWAKLPDPRDVNLTLDKINRISAAISDVKEKLIADSSEIFRELLEIMREIMLENKFSQTVQHQRDIDAAKATADARKLANEKQLSGELGSSIAALVAGGLSFAGNIVSVRSAFTSATTAKNATKLAGGIKDGKPSPGKSLDALENTVEKTKEKLSDVNSKIATANERLNELTKIKKLTKSQRTEKSALQQELKSGGTLQTEKVKAEKEFVQAKSDYKTKFDEVESLRKSADTHLAKANAWQALAGSVSSITNATGGISAASFKKQAADDQLIADAQNVNREVAQKMFSASADSANSARESLRSAMSMISAIEQTFSSMNSLLARNSV